MDVDAWQHHPLGVDGVLSETDVEVLRGMALEITGEEIGKKKLDLSAKRIGSIRSEIFIKTETKNAVGLVVYGIIHANVGERKFDFF